jgi:hypothetical protein
MATVGSITAALAIEYVVPAIRSGIRSPETVEVQVRSESSAATTEQAPRPVTNPPHAAPEVEPTPQGAVPVTVPALIERPGAIQVLLSRELALRDDYGYVVDCIRLYQGRREGIAIGLAADIRTEQAAVAAVQLAASMYRRNGLPVLVIDAGNSNEPLAQYFGAPQGPGFRDLLLGAEGSENQCVHRTAIENLWILPPGYGALNGNARPERVAWLRKALGNGSMNLVVRLPKQVNGSSWLMLYAILDGALCDLDAGHDGPNAMGETVQRIVEAKRNFDERRLTLVGGAREWKSDSSETLTVC